MGVKIPRLIIAGLSGDSGKTIVSLSLLTSMHRQGLAIAPFKKGPDYIDSAWLSTGAAIPCRNLDTYLVEPETVRLSFIRHAAKSDFALIEGNRGLYDGKDLQGTHSTAELAKLLQAPVLLVVDATKTTRTMAALVKGCQVFDPEVKIAGVVLNKIGGKRHQQIVTDSVEKYCAVPVVGAIPKLGKDASLIPGRHLGLIPPTEFMDQKGVRDKLIEIADTYLDMEKIKSIASEAPSLTLPEMETQATIEPCVKIGYFKDSVFTFYYPENLEALQKQGATLVPISSLADSSLPPIDALYIGGGFPETHVQLLAENRSLMESVKSAAEKGLPIFAECGGLIYLSRSLRIGTETHRMAGVFPIDLVIHKKPVGHGYSLTEVDGENPYFEKGTVIKGHEFHYSGLTQESPSVTTCLKVTTGIGIGGQRDGLTYKKTMACYTHIHADGTSTWAKAMVANAQQFTAGGNSTSRGGFIPTASCAGIS